MMARDWCILLWCMVGVLGGTSTPHPNPPPHPSPLPDLLTLTQDYWHWMTQDYPQFATQLGINDNTAGRLNSYSMQHYNIRKTKVEEFLERAREIDKTSLSPEDLINLNIFTENMVSYLQNFKYKRYLAPVTFLTGPQHYFKRMVLQQMVLHSYNDYQKLLSRYGEFPRQGDEIINLMKANIENKLMPSNWSMIGVIEQLDSLGGPVEDSVFYKPFTHMPPTITPEQRTTLRQQAQERIKQDLLPSFKKIRDFIELEYLPETRKEVGVASLEGGEEYYLACLKYHTSTSLTPQEIHNLGITEVTRIQKEVKKAAEEINLEGRSFSEVIEALRGDPDQSYSSKDEVLNTFRHTIYSVIYPRIQPLFNTIPPGNLTVEGDDNPNAIFARYRNPSMDETRPPALIINTALFHNHKKYEVTTLSLHESIPGHHLHNSYLRSETSIPDFRRYVDGLSIGPACFPRHTVFREGWGLYAEFLGEELGLYTDPYQRLGHYSFELLRASRLVVDTGMHALDWTRDKAASYLMQNTALSPDAIQNEINRYITWPGQACSYKIGEIKLKELRQKSQNALGSLFRLPEFHDVLLQCTGPLKIVESCVNSYIERTNSVLDRSGSEDELEGAEDDEEGETGVELGLKGGEEDGSGVGRGMGLGDGVFVLLFSLFCHFVLTWLLLR